MAEAAKKTRTITETTVTLTLTLAEAEAVAAVLGNVGGESKGTPREHSDAVFWALSKAGIDVARTSGDHAGRKISGSMKFHRSVSSAAVANGRSSGTYTTPDVLRKLGY
jgi:uncharacterized protein YfiM (DUF2279 family)